MDGDLQNLDPVTGAAPTLRIRDVTALNAVVKKLVTADLESAMSRLEVQQMADGAPPWDPEALKASGQEGRCNLNFGDGKARLKAAASGYYDLLSSVPMLARVFTREGDVNVRAYNDRVISEEWTRMMRDWPRFDARYQLLVNKFTRHGLGFFYFEDDVDWRWQVAGLEEFKLPRTITTCEDDCDVAVVFRDIPVGKFFTMMDKVSELDKRYNMKACRAAMLNAMDKSIYTQASWEKFQVLAKNNDLYLSSTAQDLVHVAYVWVREFSGRVSQYMTLRDGGNADFLFKCTNRFASVDQCFSFFLYEIGTNDTLHSVRGLGHEIYATVQVLNTLRCQTVDNAKLSGSLILQPETESDKEDLAIMFYAGAAYIPPNVKIQNNQLNNPSQGILPIIQDMTMLMRKNTGDVNTMSPVASESDKTKFEVQADLTKESVIPTANMSLFYQPWTRHLNEVWRRVASRTVTSAQPGGREIWDMRQRCIARGVPLSAIYSAKRVEPMRALGLGSPSNRLLALNDMMNYYGSLDPVRQNTLLREVFAQRMPYDQVDRFVPALSTGARGPLDVEIAELQNAIMSQGLQATVLPNDQHIIHLQQHFPSIVQDLDALETGQNGIGSPLLASAQIKIQHISEHLKLLKPDKLQGSVVADLGRQFNNAAERVQAATDYADRQAQKQQQEQAQASAISSGAPGAPAAPSAPTPPGAPPAPPTPDIPPPATVKDALLIRDHNLKAGLRADDAAQKRAIRDAAAAADLRRKFPTGIPTQAPAPAAPTQ